MSGPVYVRNVIAGGVAAQTDAIQIGDHIHQVNDASVYDKTIDDVRMMIVGQPGTQVKIQYYRPSPQELDSQFRSFSPVTTERMSLSPAPAAASPLAMPPAAIERTPIPEPAAAVPQNDIQPLMQQRSAPIPAQGDGDGGSPNLNGALDSLEGWWNTAVSNITSVATLPASDAPGPSLGSKHLGAPRPQQRASLAAPAPTMARMHTRPQSAAAVSVPALAPAPTAPQQQEQAAAQARELRELRLKLAREQEEKRQAQQALETLQTRQLYQQQDLAQELGRAASMRSARSSTPGGAPPYPPQPLSARPMSLPPSQDSFAFGRTTQPALQPARPTSAAGLVWTYPGIWMSAGQPSPAFEG